MIKNMRTFLGLGGALQSNHFNCGLAEEPQFNLEIYNIRGQFLKRPMSIFIEDNMYLICGTAPEGVGPSAAFYASRLADAKIKNSFKIISKIILK